MEIFLEDAVSSVRRVQSNRNYWFLRTYGGALFRTFIDEEYVGLGFNNVPYNYIKQTNAESTKKDKEFKNLKNYIASNTHYKGGEATKWANQLITFENIMKKGDIVVIPSKNSSRFAIGEITSDTFIVDSRNTFEYKESHESFPEKRKRVKWREIRDRSSFLLEFKSLISSQRGLTSANEYSQIIEGAISSLFVKENMGNLVIRVNRDEDINSFAFQRLLEGLNFFYKEFAESAGGDVDEHLWIKIKVQSQGGLALKGAVVAGIVGVGLIINFIDHEAVERDYQNYNREQYEQQFETFMDSTDDRKYYRKLINDSVKELKVSRNFSELAPDEKDTEESEESGKESNGGNNSDSQN